MKHLFTLSFIYLIGLLTLPPFASAQLLKKTPVPARVANQPVPDPSLQFIQNKNQWDKAIRFAADLPDGRLFLQDQGFVYNFIDGTQLPDHHHDAPAARSRAAVNRTVKGHAYRVTFLNATTNQVRLSGKNPTAGIRNYYLGRDPSRWAAGVKGYREVNYRSLYTGVDMRLYEKAGHLKYEFQLQPHVNPNQIRLQYDGATALSLQPTGDLQITTSVTTILERKPVAYQTVNGRLREVTCRFRLDGNVISFDFPGGYDARLPLLIDPVLVFSSYSSSTADNWGFTATYDNEGNIYSGGITSNVGFPATLGAYDTSWNGNADGKDIASDWDIAILKFNPAASGAASLVYATYLGGSRTDIPSSLVVNSKNELMILGTTSSDDFPVTTGAVNSVFKGGAATSPLGSNGGVTYSQGSDLIISRLSAGGNALLASTFMGGTQNDGLLDLFSPLTQNYGDQFRSDIITDTADNVYVVSTTMSADFPVQNGFQNNYGGGENDAVLFKLNPDLTALAWSSYLGGTASDAAYSIQLDAANTIFICGGTGSPDLSGLTGAFQSDFQGGEVDGFVARITNNGQTLERLSYVGTSSYDQCYFVQLDGAGDVYLLGQTTGSYPVSADVYSVANGKQFIQKLNSNLTTGAFSTVFGSNPSQAVPNISPTAFLVDDCSRIYVCGWGGGGNVNYGNGTTEGLPVTANAVQRTTDGKDFYLLLLGPNAADLEYATFMGGSQASNQSGEHVDGGTSRFDKRGIVYQAVCGGCGGNSLFPTTPNAWSKTNQSSNCNNAVFKLDLEVVLPEAGPDERICSGAFPMQLTGFSPAGGTWSGTGVSPAGLFTPSDSLVGTHVLTYTITTGTCTVSSTKTITVDPSITFTQGPDQMVCADAAPFLLSGVAPPGGTWSGKGVSPEGLFTPSTEVAGANVLTYTVRIGACQGTSTRTITVNAALINIGVEPTDCGSDSTVLGFVPFTPAFINTTTGATGYLWNFGDGTTSTEAIPNHTYTTEGTYQVMVTVFYGNGCQDTRQVVTVVTDKQQLIPNIFTPNGDGKNETFAPRITCLPTDLKVFNRWGQVVYEQKNYQNTWDGRNLPEGIYYYHLTSSKGSNWKGWVEIVR